MKLSLLLVLLVGACAPEMVESPPKPNQAEALARMDVVMGPAPQIYLEWVEGTRLDCEDGHGFMDDGGCWGGDTTHWVAAGRPTFVSVRLAGFPGWTWATSSLAHESCHVRFNDADHTGPCQYDGPLIAAGVAALVGLPNE